MWIGRYFKSTKLYRKLLNEIRSTLLDEYFEEYWVRNTARSCGENLVASLGTMVNNKTTIGNNVVLHSTKVIGTGPCNIGNEVHFGGDVKILTSNHNWRGNNLPYDDIDIEKEVNIEDYVWIGANVVILPGVTIGKASIVQAGSVVRNDIPPCSIAGGNPAIVFMKRDLNKHQEAKLKKDMGVN